VTESTPPPGTSPLVELSPDEQDPPIGLHLVLTDEAVQPDLSAGENAGAYEALAVDLLLDTTRSLLWITTPGEGREAAVRFVRGVGGHVVEAAADDPTTIPVDLSFGAGTPIVPTAPAGSLQRLLLEQHLPHLVIDVNRAVALGRQMERLAEDAALDSLTMIPNRRTVGRTLGRLRRGDVVIILDLDHFKQVNDSLGHAAGDAVLRTFGETLRSMGRSRDVAGRYGGEEFIVVLAGGDADAFLQRLRQRWIDVRPQPVSFSAGIAAYAVTASTMPAVTVAADRAMYRAKRAGRDQWLWATAGEYAQ
jgi:diguanylate cyclase (GGDEF)-like protein